MPLTDDLSPWLDLGSVDSPPLPTSGWVTYTQVTVDGEYLRFREAWDGAHVPLPPVQAGLKMLERFLGLWKEDDEAIRRYAADWGPFGFCIHGIPQRHPPLPWAPFPEDRLFLCIPLEYQNGVPDDGGPAAIQLVERLGDWRAWSRATQALLGIAGALGRGQQPDPSDTALLTTWLLGTLLHEEPLDRPPIPWMLLKETTYLWLGWSGVRLGMTPPGMVLRGKKPSLQPALELILPNLGAGLGLWATANVCRADSVAFCSSCSAPFPTRYRLRPGQTRQYCKSCREDGAPKADAQRDFMRRNPDYHKRRPPRPAPQLDPPAS